MANGQLLIVSAPTLCSIVQRRYQREIQSGIARWVLLCRLWTSLLRRRVVEFGAPENGQFLRKPNRSKATTIQVRRIHIGHLSIRKYLLTLKANPVAPIKIQLSSRNHGPGKKLPLPRNSIES